MHSCDLSPNSPPPTVDPGDPPFAVSSSTEDGWCVVRVAGELDLSTRDLVHRACLTSDHVGVVVEMSAMTFMDCCGYAALIAARLTLRQRGGSLTLRNPAGQPAQLLSLLSSADPSSDRAETIQFVRSGAPRQSVDAASRPAGAD